MTPSTPRVRFAPAPTGYLHIGSARTALFNWLYARQQGGEMILRIEDTDVERSSQQYIDVITDVLSWLGLDWDGEVVFQSERLHLYREAAERMLAEGHAYRCGCTQEEVKARAEARGGTPGYDGHCRDRDVAPGAGVVVRFRTPDDGEISFSDIIRGDVTFEARNLEDFVIVRSSGEPMFLVANAVDDADLGITHVIRGEDLINVTPKVLLLRQALGVHEVPVFAHLPLIVNEQRKKLSKRRDDVSVGDYRDRGYLPEAMVNYLALLGWGPSDGVEVRPIAEIREMFRLEDVNSASAFFDLKKLEHVNAEWVRTMEPAAFIERSAHWLSEGPWQPASFDAATFEAIAPLVQERVRTLAEVPHMVDFLFLDEPYLDAPSWEKAMLRGTAVAEILDATIEEFATCEWRTEVLHDTLLGIGEVHGLKLGKAQAPVRVAVTGRTVGPPLFESLEVLGRERTLARLEAARARLRQGV